MKFGDLKETAQPHFSHLDHCCISASLSLSLSQADINKCFHDKSNSLSQLQGERHDCRVAPTGIKNDWLLHRDRSGNQTDTSTDSERSGMMMRMGAVMRKVVCLLAWLSVGQVSGSYLPQDMNRTLQDLLQHYVSMNGGAAAKLLQSECVEVFAASWGSRHKLTHTHAQTRRPVWVKGQPAAFMHQLCASFLKFVSTTNATTSVL